MSAVAGTTINGNTAETRAPTRRLYWFKSKLNGQLLDCVLDSAATVTCIAKRCVTSSSILKSLPRRPYKGVVVGASNKPLDVDYFIRVNMVVGSPAESVSIDVVIVENLPYSCIVGTDVLAKFERWGVDNVSSTLTLNSSSIPVYDQPQFDHSVNLITSTKTSLLPGETKIVKTIAKGPGVTASRPFTFNIIMAEGVEERENRTHVRVFPSLNTVGENNINEVYIQATNTSNQTRTLGKGVKIAVGNSDFVGIDDDDPHSVNVLSNIENNMDVIDIVLDRKNLTHLSESEYAKARDVLSEFRDVFTVSSETIGQAKYCQFDIDETVSPVAVPLRRVPMHKEEIVKELLQRYKDLGIIEEIDSPFRAATVLVDKKNPAKSKDVTDRYRLCVDYRILNKQLPDSAWPTPAIDHCLDAAAGSVYLSSLDFNNGYHQIPCTDSAKYALAFSPGVGFGQYTFSGMPQGIKPAASFFQQSMEKTFRGLEHCILPPYFDDVNIKGRSFNDHIVNIRLALKRVRDAGFTLNALKCKFFQIRLSYLGHIIENGTVMIDPDRVKAIKDIPTPKCEKELRSFIGMIQFCNRFIPNLNEKISPLYNLLRKKVVYDWSEQCQAAFEYIKDVLTKPPVLKCPKPSDYFILETDASDVGIGACLRVSSDREEFVVGYHSGKLQDPQCRWHIVEKEAYAILESVEKFRHYLIGKRFTLKTDNRILSYMNTSKSKKLANWALKLSDYTFDIVHIPSKHNAVSDFFSRLHEVNIVSEFSSSLSSEEWGVAQQNCEYIKAACEYVRCKRNFDVNRLGPYKRFRKFFNLDDNDLLRWKDKIVVPPIFRVVILGIAHDHPASGHFGEDRTWKAITKHYFWPNLHNDVVNWVRSCQPCNEFGIQNYVNRPLQPIESSDRFELVCYDLAGPFLPSNNGGNTYALIMVDHFSKWCEIAALKQANAPSIATTIFEQWCCRYGIMTQLHSDGAQNVHGDIIKELCKLIGTVKSKSSRLHPQGDGMSEAMVKIVKNAVKKQVDTHGRDWDAYLQSTAFAIRSSINSSTKFTPAELLIGENLVRPIDITTENPQCSFAKKQANEFASTLSKKIDESSRIVNENLAKSRSKMKSSYDKTCSSHNIKVGDHVMLWWPYKVKGISSAFQPRWKGPYRVLRLIGDTNCSIVMGDGKTKNVHLNQLKQVQIRQNSNDEGMRCETTEPTEPEHTEQFSSNAKMVGDLFDHLYTDTVANGANPNENEEDGWCGLSNQNVILSRTRSGTVRVGDG